MDIKKEQELSTLIIYHRDMDGLASAIIAKQKYPNAEFLDVEHSEDSHKAKLYERIVLLDFPITTWNKPVTSMCKEFIWIDHHKSAMELKEWNDKSINGIRSIDEAACILTWRYFNNDKPIPKAIKLVGDRDIWKFEFGEDTKAFNEYCSKFDITDEKISWNDILLNESKVSTYINEGKQLLSYKLALIKKIVDKGYETTFEGYKTFECNSSLFISDVADYVLTNNKDIKIAKINQVLFDKTKRKVVSIYSLRSRNTEDIDVSVIAKKYGGGGHKHASGYVEREKEIVLDHLIEKLSALEHEQWSHWTKYMLGCINDKNVKRWNTEIATSYYKLDEKTKESDRLWARKVIKLLKDEKVI